MAKKEPRILYFLEGSAPLPLDNLAVIELGSNVAFRNGSVPNVSAAIEKCDGVSDPAIPDAYAHLPDGAEVIAAHRAKLKAEAAAGIEAMQALQAAPAPQAPAKPAKAASAPAVAPAVAPAAPVGNPGAAAGWTAGQ